MTTVSNHARFIVQDENLEVRHKKAAFDGKTQYSKGAAKKERKGIEARKPLGDLTNKRDVHVGVTAKKPIVQQGKFNIAEECFLHDHNKCVQANNAALRLSLSDLVFPKCDVVFPEKQDSMQQKADLDSSPIPEEMEIPDLSEWDSPPPLHQQPDSPPPSPFAWQFETVEFSLKDEN